MRKWLKIALIVLIVIVVVLVSLFAALIFDLKSYGGTGSETLNPTGTSVGRALVVYDPGFSGAASRDAGKIADDFQADNYTVVLAGVRSGDAGNVSGYSVIVAGGPVYFGRVSSSIDGFLTTVQGNARLGVFGSTGSSSLVESDFASLQQQVASATYNADVVVKLIRDGNETNDCADLVSLLVQ
jgi:hypothetical protein